MQSAIEDALSSDLSPEEARQAVEAKLAELVEDGTITDDQSSSIQSALDRAASDTKPAPPPPPKGGGIPSDITSSLSALTDEGAITEDEENSILEYLLESQENGTKPDLNDLVEDGTLSESTKDTVESTFRDAAAVTQAKRAYTGSYASADPLQSLVEDGTITSSTKSLVYQTLLTSGAFNSIEQLA